jgi:hypothetical protein
MSERRNIEYVGPQRKNEPAKDAPNFEFTWSQIACYAIYDVLGIKACPNPSLQNITHIDIPPLKYPGTEGATDGNKSGG